MARRYDQGTTTFSPEGRLYQVEYAIASVQNAASAVAILSSEGIVIAGEKKVVSKLLAPPKSSEKLYKLDDHVMCAVAGLTSDANIIIDRIRATTQSWQYRFGEPMPVEQLVRQICDYKHAYTQYGGLRPFGVSFLYAGWDKHYGFQLYHSDPSGNYAGWKATAIGANSKSAQSTLKSDYKPDLSLEEAKQLAVKVLTKAMDTTSPTSERVEVSTLRRVEGKVLQRVLPASDTDALLKEVAAAEAPAGNV